MTARPKCRACGEPIEGLLLRARDGSCYHHDSAGCIATLRDALDKARADLDALKAEFGAVIESEGEQRCTTNQS